LAFLGRITPEKGIIEAINIAKAANKKLLIAAAIDNSKMDFFENEVKPLIDNEQIIFLGEVYDQAKNDLLKNSIALLFPITWHEPFGLVLVEAMATGTPVIATDIGSVKEIIKDGKTGFILPVGDNLDNFANKIEQLNAIDRSYCRQYAIDNFSETVMVSNYLKYYESIN
jgi:glycosyltransferase involved in cell wall biosynthesis